MLRIGEADHGDIDPHQGALFADAILYYNIYDMLVFPSLDGKTTEIRPHLAESIDIDPTGTVYTIKLRANVKFHSGNTMTADDVVFSMNRMLTIQKGFSFLFTGVVKSAEAKGPLTAVITLNEPSGAFYASLVRLGIVDSKTVMAHKQAGDFGEFGDYGGGWLLKNSAGTGAYEVVSHERTERTVLRKFKDYFLGHHPKAPDVVHFTYGNNELAVLTLFKQGQMDVVRPLIQPETKKELLKIKGVTLAAEPGVNQFYFWLNNTKAPLDDVHCRRALAYAVDYEGVHAQEQIKPGLTGAKPSHGPLLETLPGFDPKMPPFAKRDLAKAKAELALCKYNPADHRIDMIWMAGNRKTERMALLLQVNWKELGFESDISNLVWAHYVTRLAKTRNGPDGVARLRLAGDPRPGFVPLSSLTTRRGAASGRRGLTSRMPRSTRCSRRAGPCRSDQNALSSTGRSASGYATSRRLSSQCSWSTSGQSAIPSTGRTSRRRA